jgi:hypothetical protein
MNISQTVATSLLLASLMPDAAHEEHHFSAGELGNPN